MWRVFLWLMLIGAFSYVSAQEYRPGRGYRLYNDEMLQLNLGGHASVFYLAQGEDNDSVGLDQAGVMLYGNITSRFRFLGEYGSDNIYTYRLDSGKSDSTDLQLMRLYGEYLFSDALHLKAGQFLTPIGIWNRTYIPALRWSAFTPYVAMRFFPKIIVGGALEGRVLDNRALGYSLFYHADGEYDTNENNVPAKEFVGGELRYHFGLRGKVALPFGRFRSDTAKEICLFTGANFLWPIGRNELSSEFLFKDGEWTDMGGFHNTWKDYAWYLQYVQHLLGSHYLSARLGQLVRFKSNTDMTWEDNNVVFGYIYRPQTALSIKAEYRHRERNNPFEIRSDEGLLTFSVLF